MIDSSQPPYFMDLRLTQGFELKFIQPTLVAQNQIKEDELVFVLPTIGREDEKCRKCLHTSQAQFLSTGGLVIGGCFHPNTNGPGDDPKGIMFEFKTDQTSLNHGRTGWRAIVEPIGLMVWVGYEGDGERATPDVLIKEIMAFCHSEHPYRVDTNPRRVIEGYLYADGSDGIVPVCSLDHARRKDWVMGQFRIEDGKPILLPMVD